MKKGGDAMTMNFSPGADGVPGEDAVPPKVQANAGGADLVGYGLGDCYLPCLTRLVAPPGEAPTEAATLIIILMPE
jgi:hypothetical protein